MTTPGTPPTPDITANLAKMVYANGLGGGTVSLRDAVDIAVSAAPPVAIVKGVADVNDVPAGGNPVNTDGVTVRQNDVVTFRVDYTNNGSAAGVNALPIETPDLWDVLPAGIDCADISAISDGGVCTDPAAAGHPPFAERDTRSAIRWNLTAAPPLAPGATATLTYNMTIPAEVSVSTTFTNTASVASYTVRNNLGERTVLLPADNVDTTVDAEDENVPAAADPSNVVTPGIDVTKSNVTDITEQNNGLNQAVVGETLRYTIGAVIPAQTTVYNAALTDPMPTGITYLSSTAAFSATGTSPATGPLPDGFTLDPVNGSLTFPATYVNNTGSPQLFEVIIEARVSTLAGNAHNIGRTNTATFTSDSAPFGGVALPEQTATSTVTVVEPQANITKTNDDADGSVVGGQQLTYTLAVQGEQGRPPTHDAWVIDCIPAGLEFIEFVAPVSGTAASNPGTGSNGCAAGTTRVAWNLPTATTAAVQLQYRVTVATTAVGGVAYTNPATVTGSSLNDGKTDPLAPDNPLERSVSSSTSDTVSVATGVIVKSADPSILTVGERGTWTISVTLTPNVNFYDSAIIDELPAGIDPASVVTESITCTVVDVGPCVFPDETNLTQAPGPNGSTLIGWGVGDVLARPNVRFTTITYSAVVQDLAAVNRGDALTNIARAGWNRTDGENPVSAAATFDLLSNDTTATVTVVEPSMSIDKSVSDPTPSPGEVFTYSIDLTNLVGPNTSPAYNLQLVDVIPQGVVVDPSTISPGGVLVGAGPNGGGTITWILPGPVNPGVTDSVTYDATLAPSETLDGTALLNTADLATYESLPSGGRVYETDPDSAAVTPAFPHASVTKSVSPGPAYIGEPKTFTVTVTSDGDATAYNIRGRDELAPNWTYDVGSSVVSIAGGPATPVDPIVTQVGGRQVLTYPNLTDLPVGQQVVLTYTATPQPDVVDDPGVGTSVPHPNTVTISAEDGTGADGNANGTYAGPPATAIARIASADVGVDKTHTGNPVAGQNFTWTLTVRNAGPDTAVGPFPVVDTLPAGIGSATAAGTGWTCSTATTTITCNRTNPANTLAAGAAFPVITVTTAIPAGTPSGTVFTNGVAVDSRTYDPDETNNTDTDSATSVRSVDLAIDKSLTGDLVAGEKASYQLVVRNNGPSDSLGPIVVTDTVPAGTNFVSATGPGWDCEIDGDDITCTRTPGLLAGGTAAAITLVIAVPADRTAAVVNTAVVSGPSPDPVPANNTDTVTTTPRTSADLAIEKESTTRFVAGEQGSYRFTVNNFGPSDARAVVRITDALPDGLSYASFDSVTGTWTCSADADDNVTCDLSGPLPAGAEAVVEITVDIDSAVVCNIHNEATVDSPTTDPNPTNNTDDDDTQLDVEADLQIVKSHAGTAVAGQNLTFTLAVTNNGPSDSGGPIEVTDIVPAGMTVVSAGGSGWTCVVEDQQVDCTLADGLDARESAEEIAVVVAIAPDAGPDTLYNNASVGGPEVDPVPGNNTDIDEVVVVDDANISVSKATTGANPVNAGDTTRFTIVVHNDGPSTADDVSFTDALPTGLTLVSVDTTGWDCTDTSPLTCTLDELAPDADAPAIVLTVRVGAGVADGSTLTNTAVVSTSTPGDDPADNTDDADVEVTTDADLALTKSHTPGGTYLAGEQVTFDLVAENAGPSDALAPIEIVDTLPDGLSYVSSDGPWTCSAAAQQVTCTLTGDDALLAGTTAPTLQITAQIAAGVDPGSYSNVANLDSGTPDSNPDNNTDTDEVAVEVEADLSIVKSHTGAVRIGDPLTFELQVANAGPSEAREVTLTDEIPAALEYVSATGTDWTCAVTGTTLQCSLAGPLAPNTDAPPISVTVTVLAAAYPSVDNTAEVDSSTPDGNAGNNEFTDTVEVPAQVDLAITKTHTGPVQVGGRLTYTLSVVNNGPTDDPGPVTVTDPLPAGLSYVSAGGPGWTCTAVAGTVTCTDADGLAVDETSQFTITVDVGPDAYPSVTNVATVTSPAEDIDPENNIASDPTAVDPLIRLTVRKELLSISQTEARYRLTVTNRGLNATISDIVVIDQLPPQLTYVSSSGGGWSCTPAGRTVTCQTSQVLGAGESASFEMITAVAAGTTGTVTNDAQVLPGEPTDPGGRDSATGSIDADSLPQTGSAASLTLLWLALVMVSVGTGLVLAGRRRVG